MPWKVEIEHTFDESTFRISDGHETVLFCHIDAKRIAELEKQGAGCEGLGVIHRDQRDAELVQSENMAIGDVAMQVAPTIYLSLSMLLLEKLALNKRYVSDFAESHGKVVQQIKSVLKGK